MRSMISVSPFRCRMWHLHDRLEDLVTEESCREEIQSFSDHGQLVPVLGRRLHNDPEHEIELIYGARRLFAARHINTPLVVELRELSDRDAIIAMDLENRHRKDISPYERGLSYVRWLRTGYFQSQDEIARALKVSASQVSRLLKLARLPSAIIEAFGSALDIRELWGMALADALEDPEMRRPIIRAARSISATSPRPPAQDVYRQLMTAPVSTRRSRTPTHDKVVRDDEGEPLFRVRFQRTSVALLMPAEKITSAALEAVERAVARVIQEHRPEPELDEVREAG